MHSKATPLSPMNHPQTISIEVDVRHRRGAVHPFPILLFVAVSTTWMIHASRADTVLLDNLRLVEPHGEVNSLDVEVAVDVLGADQAVSQLAGRVIAELEIDFQQPNPEPTEITFLGGMISASDVSFQLGLVDVVVSNLHGMPGTTFPPGTIVDGEFLGGEHQVVLDRGTIGAVGRKIDFADEPEILIGRDVGFIELERVDDTSSTYNVTVELPVMVADVIELGPIPLFGQLQADFQASTRVVARQQISLEAKVLAAGDANQDFAFDQSDLVQVAVANKYLSGLPATWGDGDWDAAPGGRLGTPPEGNGLFDQQDIIAALGNGLYLTGPYAAFRSPLSDLTESSWATESVERHSNVEDLKTEQMLPNADMSGVSTVAVPEPQALLLITWMTVATMAMSRRKFRSPR